MLWLNPSALFALAGVAAPILIHILVQRRAERFPFPTLRFLRPTRLAAIRRHVLEDIVLLAVRVAVIAAAVAALAGPLLVTAARRQAWDRRVVRAVVVDDSNIARAFQARDRGPEGPALQQIFTAPSLPDGMRRAMLWLDTAPPARRELVVASPFPIGSITEADVGAIPSGVGVRFEWTGTLPGTRTMAAGRLLTSGGVRAREVTLAGDQTLVRDAATAEPMVWPIDVVSSKAEQPAIDAAVAAVLSQRVWAAPPDRRARLVLVEPRISEPTAGMQPPSQPTAVVQAFGPAIVDGLSDVSPVQQPWMADAAARIAGDLELRAAAARVTV